MTSLSFLLFPFLLSLSLFLLPTLHCLDLLTITSPPSLLHYFSWQNVNGSILESPALFGDPKDRTGFLIPPPSPPSGPTASDVFGCSAYLHTEDSLYYRFSVLHPTPFIVLLQRGGNCFFVDKVRNAMHAGAAGVIVYDNMDYYGYLPYMASAGTSDTKDINIPSMFIRKLDGQLLMNYLLTYDPTDPQDFIPIQMSMKYLIPRPDGRVEFDLWSLAMDNNTDTKNFKSTIGSAMRLLGDSVLLTPHYYTRAGEAAGCVRRYPTACGSQCTNRGKYCEPDPELDLSKGFDGMNIVQENVREICIVKLLNITEQNIRIYDYWESFYSRCTSVSDWASSACSYAALDSLNIPLVNSVSVAQCIVDSGDYQFDTASDNALLKEELRVQNQYSIQIIQLPQALVNNNPYRGTLGCPTPITLDSCGILNTICDGFAPGTAPSICGGNPLCPFGSPDCVLADKESSNNGVSVGTITAIVIVLILVMGGIAFGVYLYMRRQQKRMREDVDQLLKQYLPLDEGPLQMLSQGGNRNNGNIQQNQNNGRGHGNGNGQRRGGEEERSRGRVIRRGEDDGEQESESLHHISGAVSIPTEDPEVM